MPPPRDIYMFPFMQILKYCNFLNACVNAADFFPPPFVLQFMFCLFWVFQICIDTPAYPFHPLLVPLVSVFLLRLGTS